MRAGQISGREGMLLERDEVQLRTSLRIILPGEPSRQEVRSEAESGLEDDETTSPPPTPRQAIAAHEDMRRLRVPTRSRVVDIAVSRRIRRSIIGKNQAGEFE